MDFIGNTCKGNKHKASVGQSQMLFSNTGTKLNCSALRDADRHTES